MDAGSHAGGDSETLAVVRIRRRIRLAGPGAAAVTLALDATLQQGAGLSLAQPSVRRRIEGTAAAQAGRQLRDLLARLQVADADVLGLGERERERDPAAAADWTRRFPDLRIRSGVTVPVETNGQLH